MLLDAASLPWAFPSVGLLAQCGVSVGLLDHCGVCVGLLANCSAQTCCRMLGGICVLFDAQMPAGTMRDLATVDRAAARPRAACAATSFFAASAASFSAAAFSAAAFSAAAFLAASIACFATLITVDADAC